MEHGYYRMWQKLKKGESIIMEPIERSRLEAYLQNKYKDYTPSIHFSVEDILAWGLGIPSEFMLNVFLKCGYIDNVMYLELLYRRKQQNV